MPARVENLRESTHRSVRLVALGHLADASAARDRLADSADDEALHDFRVALRRLRSWERAFRPYVRDDVSKRLRRRLRNLARDTGASRDLEVHLAWLTEQRRSLGRRQRTGLNWLLANLQHRKAEADAVLSDDVDTRFARLESRLARALASYRERLNVRDDGRAEPPPAFAEALAPRVRRAASELRDHLERVHSVTDERDAHEARIAAKRLRYLLEPVTKVTPGATELVDRLKLLQDVLGDLHDAQVFGAEIEELAADVLGDAAPNADTSAEGDDRKRASSQSAAEAAAEAAAEGATDEGSQPPSSEPTSTGASPGDTATAAASGDDRPLTTPSRERDLRPGIVAIGQRLRDRATAAFSQFAGEWLGDHSAAFFHDLHAVSDRIAQTAREGVEIERKYLLRFLPEEARDGRRIDIAQGYMPGARLQERIRRVSIHHGSGRKDVHYYRTVKLGEGVTRTEIEEETTEAIFAAMWPLTKRHRLRKRRFEVEVDGRRWEIDDFKNRNLVMAEIELESEDEEVTFPDWLAPAVQREVTTEPEFQNINLAR
jgi:CHAD domain-containing protein/CYTH domain-containing protein